MCWHNICFGHVLVRARTRRGSKCNVMDQEQTKTSARQWFELQWVAILARISGVLKRRNSHQVCMHWCVLFFLSFLLWLERLDLLFFGWKRSPLVPTITSTTHQIFQIGILLLQSTSVSAHVQLLAVTTTTCFLESERKLLRLLKTFDIGLTKRRWNKSAGEVINCRQRKPISWNIVCCVISPIGIMHMAKHNRQAYRQR